MRLDSALVSRKLCESRVEAQELIEGGHVQVNGEIVRKQAKEVTESAVLTVTAGRNFVSRGGDKLDGALLYVFGDKENVHANIDGKNAIDIGSSTGGFTDCLLSYGADSVTAVDVGSSQLHKKLLDNARVCVLENTDIRSYVTDQKFDLIVVDLSFISLEKILNTIFSFGHSGSHYFLLIKPQFEVGKGNTKKGIVKNENLVNDILRKYSLVILEKGMIDVEVFACALPGRDGNQEYFLYARQ